MRLVIDASMALSWLFERTVKAEAHCAERALSMVEEMEAWVPNLWHTEIANGLLVGERRQVITEAQVIDYRRRLSALPIVTDVATPASRSDAVMALAREHRLTAYDATYLDLALRSDAILATFDLQLSDAMQRAGGKIFCEKFIIENERIE